MQLPWNNLVMFRIILYFEHSLFIETQKWLLYSNLIILREFEMLKRPVEETALKVIIK